MTGSEFRAARIKLGLEQKEICKILGVSSRTILNQEKSEQVYPIYSYAIRFLLIQSGQQKIDEISADLEKLIQ